MVFTLAGVGRVDGEGEEEAGAVAGVGGVDVDFAVESLGYHAADVEAEAGAGGEVAEFFEAFEDDFFFSFGDADAGVFDGECDGVVVGVECVAEVDVAFFGEFGAVVEKVDEHLLYAAGVGGDEYIEVGGVEVVHGHSFVAVFAHGVDGYRTHFVD